MSYTGTDIKAASAGNEAGATILKELQERQPYLATSVDLTLLVDTHGGRAIRTNTSDKDLTLPSASVAGEGWKATMIVGVASSTGLGATLKVTSPNNINAGTDGKGLISEGSNDAVGDSVAVISDGLDWWTVAKVGTWIAEP